MFMNIHELPHNLTYDYDDVEVILAIYRLCGFILKYRLLKFETFDISIMNFHQLCHNIILFSFERYKFKK